MKYLSLFSGIEAASVAWHPLGWKPWAFAEIEPFPAAVLAHHFPEVPNLGDVTKFQEWPDAKLDLIVGGSPCQAFSLAGLRKGLADPRGNLALTYIAIVNKYRPEWFIWENVPGVLSSLSHDAPDQCPPEIDLEGDHGPRDGEEVVVADEYEADENHSFGTFIAGLQEIGYCCAWRIVDAQYTRVDGFERAVPQRRRRIFVVGHISSWQRAAAVLFESPSSLGDFAPSRKAREDVAGTLTGGARKSGGFSYDDIELTAFGGNNTSGPIEVSTAINAHGGPHGRMDFESETFVAQVAPALVKSNHHGDKDGREGHLVAHTLRAEGFDASEDGTGRGTPLVPVHAPDIAATLTRGAESAGKGGYAGRRQEDEVNLIAFNARQDPIHSEEVSLPLDTDGTTQAMAFQPRFVRNDRGGPSEIAYALTAEAGSSGKGDAAQCVAYAERAIGFSTSSLDSPRDDGTCPPVKAQMNGQGTGAGPSVYVAHEVEQETDWAVRRLIPLECERLQGFPDNWTNITFKGKPASDGARYKACGNSMAVNVMRWIGTRLQMVADISDVEIAAMKLDALPALEGVDSFLE